MSKPPHPAKRYFGTDGIRGVAGKPPLDPATVYAVGLALGDDLRARNHASSHPVVLGPVVLGEDTRESSHAIACQLAAGLIARGFSVAHAGVLPTPGIAFLTASGHFCAGVMISASHNPYQDNGIKIFGSNGYKLPDADEATIETLIERYRRQPPASPATLRPAPELRAEYVKSLVDRFRGTDFTGLRIVLDCGNGAASTVAPEACAALGLAVELMATAPDGRNINAGVGALHPEGMAAQVRATGAHAGVSLDGDADRAILADAGGALVNGDCVLYMAGRDLQSRAALQPPVVVGTVMTNFGLEQALSADGIRLERTPVGDKYVLERMLATGALLGGEPSGHVIFGAEATTGDGLLTALHCFALVAQRRVALRDLCAGWQALPQVLLNVRVSRKQPLEQLPGVQAAIRAAEQALLGSGRVLVRYSGTELLARVMVEGPDAAVVAHHASHIAQTLQEDVDRAAAGS